MGPFLLFNCSLCYIVFSMLVPKKYPYCLFSYSSICISVCIVAGESKIRPSLAVLTGCFLAKVKNQLHLNEAFAWHFCLMLLPYCEESWSSVGSTWEFSYVDIRRGQME